METHDQKMFSLLQQFSGKDEDHIRRVTHLRWCQSSLADRKDLRTSDSCACDAMTSSFAAGWTTSTSLMIVAASEVTNNLPRWLITSLFRPMRTSVSRVEHNMNTDHLARSSFVRDQIVPRRPECFEGLHPRDLAGAVPRVGDKHEA